MPVSAVYSASRDPTKQKEGTMTRKRIIFIVTFIVIFGSTLAWSAVSTVSNLYVRDDAVFGSTAIVHDGITALDWLHLPLTGTKSYNDMTVADESSEFEAGGQFAGFCHTTMAEVKQLWVDAGIPADYFYETDSSDNHRGIYQTNNSTAVSAERTLQNLIGYSETQAYLPYMMEEGWRTMGLAAVPGGIGMPQLDTCTPGTGFYGGSSVPMLRAHLESHEGIQNQIGRHHWLVREAVKVRGKNHSLKRAGP